MNKIFRKKTILILLLICIAISSLSLVFISAKYAGMSIIDGLRLFITGQLPDDDYVEGEELEDYKSVPGYYHILYVTYNGTRNVIAAEDLYSALTDIATIRGEITNAEDNASYGKEGHEFIGWSTIGVVNYTVDALNNKNYDNNMASLYDGDKVALSKLIAECNSATLEITGFDEPQVFDDEAYGKGYITPPDVDYPNKDSLTQHVYIVMYDMYSGGPVLTIEPHNDMKDDIANGEDVLVNIYSWLFPDEIGSLSDENISNAYCAKNIYMDGKYYYVNPSMISMYTHIAYFDAAESFLNEAGIADELDALAKQAALDAVNGTDFVPPGPSDEDINHGSDVNLRSDELYNALEQLYGSVYAREYSNIYEYCYSQVYRDVYYNIVPSFYSAFGAAMYDAEMARLFTDFYSRIYAELLMSEADQSYKDDAFIIVGEITEHVFEFFAGYMGNNPNAPLEKVIEESEIYARTYLISYVHGGLREDTTPTAAASAQEMYLEYKTLTDTEGKSSAYAYGYFIADTIYTLSTLEQYSHLIGEYAAAAAERYDSMIAGGYDPVYSYRYTEQYMTVYRTAMTAAADGQAIDLEQYKTLSNIYAECVLVAVAMGMPEASAGTSAFEIVDACYNILVTGYEGEYRHRNTEEYLYFYSLICDVQGINDSALTIADAMYNKYTSLLNGSTDIDDIITAKTIAMGSTFLSSDVLGEGLSLYAYRKALKQGCNPADAFAIAQLYIGNDAMRLAEYCGIDFENINDIDQYSVVVLRCFINLYNTLYTQVYNTVYDSLLENAQYLAETNGTSLTAEDINAVATSAEEQTIAVLKIYAQNAVNSALEKLDAHGLVYTEEYVEVYIEFLKILLAQNIDTVLNKDTVNNLGGYDEIELAVQEYTSAVAQKYAELKTAQGTNGLSDSEIGAYTARYAYAYVEFKSKGGLSVYNSAKLAVEYAEMYLRLKNEYGISDVQANGYAYEYALLYRTAFLAGYDSTVAKQYAFSVIEGCINDSFGVYCDYIEDNYGRVVSGYQNDNEMYEKQRALINEAMEYTYAYLIDYCLPYTEKYIEMIAAGETPTAAENYATKYALAYVGLLTRNNDDDTSNDLPLGSITVYADAYINAYFKLKNDALVAALLEKLNITEETEREEFFVKMAKNYGSLYGYSVLKLHESEMYAEGYAEFYITNYIKYLYYEDESENLLTHLASFAPDAKLEAYEKETADKLVLWYFELYSKAYAGRYAELRELGVEKADAEETAAAYAIEYRDTYLTKYFNPDSVTHLIPDAAADMSFNLVRSEAYSHAYAETFAATDNSAYANAYAFAYAYISADTRITADTPSLEEYAEYYASKYTATLDKNAAYTQTFVYIQAHMSAIAEGENPKQAALYAEAYVNAIAEIYDTFLADQKISSKDDAHISREAFAEIYASVFTEKYAQLGDEAKAETYAVNYANYYGHAYQSIIAYKNDSGEQRYSAKVAETVAAMYAEKRADLVHLGNLSADDADARAEAKAYVTAYLDALNFVDTPEGTGRDAFWQEIFESKYKELTGAESAPAADDGTAAYAYSSLYASVYVKTFVDRAATMYTELKAEGIFANDQEILNYIAEIQAVLIVPFADNYASAYTDVYTTYGAECAALFENKFNEVHDAKRQDFYEYYTAQGLTDSLLREEVMNSAFGYADGYAGAYVKTYVAVLGATDENGNAYSKDFALREAEKYVARYSELYNGIFETAYDKYVNIIDAVLEGFGADMTLIRYKLSSAFAQHYAEPYIYALASLTYRHGILSPADVEECANVYAEAYALAVSLEVLDGVSLNFDISQIEVYISLLTETFYRMKNIYGASYNNALDYAYAYAAAATGMSGDMYNTLYQNAQEYVAANYPDLSEEQKLIAVETYVEAYIEYAKRRFASYCLDLEASSIIGDSVPLDDLLGYGHYASKKYYSLTSETDSLTFLVHSGLIITSGGRSRIGLFYEIPGDDSTMYDVYSFLFDDPDAVPNEVWASDGKSVDVTNRYGANVSDRVPVTGDITLYAYAIKTTSSGATCVAEGTLITLADGTKAPVEQLTDGQLVRVYDHELGEYTTAPILFIKSDGIKYYNVINLAFSNGTTSRIIYEHGFFDLDLNKYVYITEDNYPEYIGHRFAVESDTGYGVVTLTDAYATLEKTSCYSMTTAYYMNHFVDGMFSMPGSITGFFNYFEYGEDLAYDSESMQADIEKYGLYTAADFPGYISEEMFNEIYPSKYLKIAVGKGLLTRDDIIAIFECYIIGHGLV